MDKKQLIKDVISYAIMICMAGAIIYYGVLNPPSQKPNVVLLLIDTVRADHLSCYGYEKPTTPNIDQLAKEGLVYANCHAQALWTLPAMATIFTGVSQRAHGINTRDGYMTGIPDDYTTLPEILDNAGYDTYGLFNVPVMAEEYGFHQGFDHISDEGCIVTIDADSVVNNAITWLDERDNQSGFFMCLHFFDAHYAYDPPPEYWHMGGIERPEGLEFLTSHQMADLARAGQIIESDVATLEDLYDLEIRFVDDEIGRLMDELKERGLYENTIFVVISDHGEEFLEHGFILHGFQFYQETIHVPFIIAGPGIGERLVVKQPVGQYDLLPTLAHLLDLDIPEYVEGMVALPGQVGHNYIPTSGDLSNDVDIAVIRRQSSKIWWSPTMDGAVGYDLSSDPMEEHPMAAHPAFQEMIEQYWATPRIFPPINVPLSEERAARIRDLGYIR